MGALAKWRDKASLPGGEPCLGRPRNKTILSGFASFVRRGHRLRATAGAGRGSGRPRLEMVRRKAGTGRFSPRSRSEHFMKRGILSLVLATSAAFVAGVPAPTLGADRAPQIPEL